jgi:hypothetical protein
MHEAVKNSRDLVVLSTHDYDEATREAAMAAFAKSWRRSSRDRASPSRRQISDLRI